MFPGILIAIEEGIPGIIGKHTVNKSYHASMTTLRSTCTVFVYFMLLVVPSVLTCI
jgi:hypothetical protein